jgi:hypothetical protein
VRAEPERGQTRNSDWRRVQKLFTRTGVGWHCGIPLADLLINAMLSSTHYSRQVKLAASGRVHRVKSDGASGNAGEERIR